MNNDTNKIRVQFNGGVSVQFNGREGQTFQQYCDEIIEKERAIYRELRAIGAQIAYLAQDMKHQGGDHDYDGAIQEVWRGMHDAMGVDGSECDLIVYGTCEGSDDHEEFPKNGYKRKAISPSVQLKVYRADGFKCVHCGTSADLSVDHIYPVSRGGTNAAENLQTLCRPCNSRKGAKVDDNTARKQDS